MAGAGIKNSTISAEPRVRIPLTGRGLRLLAFYLGVPLVISIYGALNNWELLQTAGYPVTLAFYAAHGFPPWWMTCASTSLAMWALRSIKPPPSVLLALGMMLGGLIALPYTNWLTALASEYWQNTTLTQQVAPLFSVDFWRYIARATIIWFGVNFVFDRFLGLPRYRYVVPRGYDFAATANGAKSDPEAPGPPAAAIDSPLPGFLARMPVRITVADILAIKAEQHYIRVFTPQREYMILYRFSDAVREMEPATGLQVHRSYWVSKTAMGMVRPSAKKFSIRLTTGTCVPVSTPYHGVVKEFARAHHLPMRQ